MRLAILFGIFVFLPLPATAQSDDFNKGQLLDRLLEQAIRKCDTELLMDFISIGGSPNQYIEANNSLQSLLHVAANANCYKALGFLLTAGSDPNTFDQMGKLPVEVTDNPECRKLLRDALAENDKLDSEIGLVCRILARLGLWHTNVKENRRVSISLYGFEPGVKHIKKLNENNVFLKGSLSAEELREPFVTDYSARIDLEMQSTNLIRIGFTGGVAEGLQLESFTGSVSFGYNGSYWEMKDYYITGNK